ncbi:MAG: hypothetical protein E7390_07750 [Ruminococcaceae bacterium]|nr:hypothetical protein [Oscillospiraceae bacterium]
MDKDKIWLWGQTPGAHHKVEKYRLPGVNRMTVTEGMQSFGIENVCRVRMQVDKDLSFEKEIEILSDAKKIVLSIIGSGGCSYQEEGKDDLAEIISLAKKYPKVTGGIMDDFIRPQRLETYTPDVLRRMRERLHTAINRELDFWTVIYDRDFEQPFAERMREFDVCTYWTWYGENLLKLDEHFNFVREQGKNMRMMLGVYMWDYGNGQPLSSEKMYHQLEFADKKYKSGEIEGIILCSNCIGDIGLEAADIMRNWIQSCN